MYPSETTAARAARGRHRVQVELSTDARARLDELAAVRDTSKSAVVEGLIMGPMVEPFVEPDEILDRVERATKRKAKK